MGEATPGVALTAALPPSREPRSVRTLTALAGGLTIAHFALASPLTVFLAFLAWPVALFLLVAGPVATLISLIWAAWRRAKTYTWVNLGIVASYLLIWGILWFVLRDSGFTVNR